MSYDRPRSRGYFDHDRHSRDRIIFRSNSRTRRSTSQPRITDREMANELEERNMELKAISESLKTELAVVEGRNWQLTSDNSALREMVRILKIEKEVLRTENDEKAREIGDLEERVDRLEGRREMAEERVRMMRRGFTGRGILSEGGLKQRLEEKVAEVDRLEDMVRVLDAKISEKNRWLAEKDNKLNYLKRWLVDRGFHVAGV